MNNKGRVLTIRVVVTDPDKIDWIWENHMFKDRLDVGVQVRAISEGDLFAEIDKLERDLEKAELLLEERD